MGRLMQNSTTEANYPPLALRTVLFLSLATFVSALLQHRAATEMGVYIELPNHLTEVDVVLAGGKLKLSRYNLNLMSYRRDCCVRDRFKTQRC